jgi:hypothetical protein
MSSNRGGRAPQAAFSHLQGAAEALNRNWHSMNKNARARELGRISKAVEAINNMSSGLTARQRSNAGWAGSGRSINAVLNQLTQKYMNQMYPNLRK